MLDILFLRKLETGREKGEYYYQHEALRCVELFSYVATGEEKSLLEIAYRAAKVLAHDQKYPATDVDLMKVYMGTDLMLNNLDKAVTRWNLFNRPPEYDVTRGGDLNPATMERFLRRKPELYKQYMEKENERGQGIIQPLIKIPV